MPKKLKKAGLPNVNYIEQREGTYFWTEQIPVVEDAWEFEKLYEQAERETDPEQSLRLYLEACYIYTGNFSGIRQVPYGRHRRQGDTGKYSVTV